MSRGVGVPDYCPDNRRGDGGAVVVLDGTLGYCWSCCADLVESVADLVDDVVKPDPDPGC